MSTHNIGFYEDLTKIIFQLSSNTHLISSSSLCVIIKVNVWLIAFVCLNTMFKAPVNNIIVMSRWCL